VRELARAVSAQFHPKLFERFTVHLETHVRRICAQKFLAEERFRVSESNEKWRAPQRLRRAIFNDEHVDGTAGIWNERGNSRGG
jgi:hypothetical protein